MREQLGPSYGGKRKDRVVAEVINSYRDLGGSELRTNLKKGVVADILQAGFLLSAFLFPVLLLPAFISPVFLSPVFLFPVFLPYIPFPCTPLSSPPPSMTSRRL